MTEKSTYPLRLPRSLKKAIEKQSEEDGTSINQFVATAVAEKLAALQVAEFFAKRKARADFEAFDKIMRRRRRKPPRTGDECHIDGQVERAENGGSDAVGMELEPMLDTTAKLEIGWHETG